MKVFIKKRLPENFIYFIYRKKLKYKLLKMYYIDFKRYSNSAFLMQKHPNIDNLKARITLNYHSIEKGLTSPNIRLGFGKRALNALFSALEEYSSKGFPVEDLRYKTAISVIRKYIILHNEKQFDVRSVESRFNNLTLINNSDLGGIKEVNKEVVLSKRNSNFSDLSKYRSSVRDFSNESVDIELINHALQIAMKTPSVCNRQPWNVRVIKDKNLMGKILKIQAGLTEDRQKKIDTLITITAKNQYLSGPEERNQGFIDGGLFSMSVLYALEHLGLATCTLNADLNIKNEVSIRKELDILDTENIILFIAVGHYPDNLKVPKSERDHFRTITKYY